MNELPTIKRLKTPKLENEMYSVCGWNANKEQQRKRVLDFCLDSCGDKIHSLTLPGRYFVFEQMLFNAAKQKDLTLSSITVEKNTRTFELGLPHIPRRWPNEKTQRPQYRFNFGHCECAQTGHTPRNQTHFNCDVEPIVTGRATFPTWKNKKMEKKILKNFNLVWLDTNSPLGSITFGEILGNIYKVLSPKKSVVAFSFLIGRDDPGLADVFKMCPGESPIEQRAAYVEWCLSKYRNIISTDVFGHKSAGGAQMATVCLLLDGIE